MAPSPPTCKPRQPWLAAFLTVVSLGLGHIYAGHARKGMVLFLAGFLVSLLSIPFWRPHYLPATLIVSLLSGSILLVYSVIDAWRLARRRKPSCFRLKNYNRWYVYLAVILINYLLLSPMNSYLLRHYYLQAFKIPGDSMRPTLLGGDRILVDKHLYRDALPRRGDIVIFPHPSLPGQALIKRIVGVPGDRIELRDKILILNGRPLREDYAIHLDPNLLPSSHGPRDNFGPLLVPSGAVFVLGDNRDRSQDSRFLGPVQIATVEGRAFLRYWSRDRQSGAIRWNRINTAIR